MINLKKVFGMAKGSDVDMTTGSIPRHIITFAIPLLIGNIFQQLYNMVDTWVVGRFVGTEAFSAVGSVGPIINMLIGFFMGLSSGAGVVISQYYGAAQEKEVKKAVHTSILMTLIIALVFTAVGVIITPLMLGLMDTPPDVFPEARTYLTIYFSGVAGLMFYNIGSGILRAVGDSMRPFYYLVVSALLNTVLDLLFVIKFNMGVAGVAYATIIAQGISALLVIVSLAKSDSCIKLTLRDMKMSWEMLRKIVKVGIPASIQMAITAFSNVFVQGYINYFGSTCMAGWTAYAKIDAIMFLPMQSIALASTTFVGQNLGGNKPERARKGADLSLLMALGATLVMMMPVMIFSPQLVAFFNDNPGVIDMGTLMLRWITPFYLLCTVNQVYSGALRGAGNTKAPVVIMLSSFVVFRQIYLFIMSNFISNEVVPIIMGYPAGWLLCSLTTFIYYKKTSLTKTRLVGD